nr:MAG TPA: hypothetical protein [Caudoviricetes sp.]
MPTAKLFSSTADSPHLARRRALKSTESPTTKKLCKSRVMFFGKKRIAHRIRRKEVKIK